MEDAAEPAGRSSGKTCPQGMRVSSRSKATRMHALRPAASPRSHREQDRHLGPEAQVLGALAGVEAQRRLALARPGGRQAQQPVLQAPAAELLGEGRGVEYLGLEPAAG